MPCDAARSKLLSEAIDAAVGQCVEGGIPAVNAALVEIVGEAIANALPKLEELIRADIYAEVIARLEQVARMDHEVCALTIQLNHVIERWRHLQLEMVE
jgi:hypothetical protein